MVYPEIARVMQWVSNALKGRMTTVYPDFDSVPPRVWASQWKVRAPGMSQRAKQKKGGTDETHRV